MEPRVFEDLWEGEGEILMEGSQRGCTSSCQGVHDFPVEQVIVHTSCRTASTITDSKA
jgi:hypothetical protein